jgi:hypothetical protein
LVESRDVVPNLFFAEALAHHDGSEHTLRVAVLLLPGGRSYSRKSSRAAYRRHIDFAFVRETLKASYSHTGRPSIDPEVLLRILLIGYLYGITSERRLVEDVGLHLAYRWFTGLGFDQEVPHHSFLISAQCGNIDYFLRFVFHKGPILKHGS